jgi:hypothetical protein
MKHTELLQLIGKISGSGHFVHQGAKSAGLYGITVNGFGEVQLPVIPVVAKALLKVAKPAPFGQGSKTVYDKKVRSTHEIDASAISFSSDAWEKLLKTILKEVKDGLGLGKAQVEAHLYKMLIYQPGDFFVPHRDSEKEKGMFGTLIIGLPSKHTGGELCIRANGKEEVADFGTALEGTLPYVAFFADCEHEVKPLLTGFRICLAYNLVKSGTAVQFDNPNQHTPALSTWLTAYQKAETDTEWPKVIMFDHQYTPANFSLNHLKGADRPRATALLAACEAASMYASACLLTYYEAGSWEPDYVGRRGSKRYGRSGDWYDDYDLDEENPSGTMGEVYDSSIGIEHWAESVTPGLGDIDIDPDKQVWSNEAYDKSEPIEKQAEGPTGNAGMELQYWYHYAAVAIWPKAMLYDCLPTDANICLNWLNYFVDRSKKGDASTAKEMEHLLLNYDYSAAKDLKNADPILHALVLLNNKKLAKELASVLAKQFYAIQPKAFSAFADTFGETITQTVLTEALSQSKHEIVTKAVLALNELSVLPNLRIKLIENLHKAINKELFKTEESASWHVRYETEPPQLGLIKALIQTSRVQGVSPKFAVKMADLVESMVKRKLIFSTLKPALLDTMHHGAPLHQTLFRVAIFWLTNRTKTAPQPPPNWTRPYPKEWDGSKHICHELVPFMQSDTQIQYKYIRPQNERSQVEYAISGLDLIGKTIKVGSPHTLLLTKNQAAFDAEMKKYMEEVRLLDQLVKLV